MPSAAETTLSVWRAAVAFNPPQGPGVPAQALEAVHWLIVGVGWTLILLLIGLRLARGRAVVLCLGPVRASRMYLEMIAIPIFAFLAATWLIHPLMEHIIPPAPAVTTAPTTAPAEGLTGRDRMVRVAVNNAAMIFGAAACYLVGRRLIGTSSRTFFSGERRYGRDVFEGFVGALAAIALCYTVLILTQLLVRAIKPGVEFSEHNVINVMRDAGAPPWMAVLLWWGAVIATPLAEETFFRGLVQTMIGHYLKNRGWAIVLAGLLFGLAHSAQWQVVPAIALFGMILGLLYERTGSLVAPVVAHAIFNAKTMLWLALAGH